MLWPPLKDAPTYELVAGLPHLRDRSAVFVAAWLLGFPIMGIAMVVHPYIGLMGFFSELVLGIVSAVLMIRVFEVQWELKAREKPTEAKFRKQ